MYTNGVQRHMWKNLNVHKKEYFIVRSKFMQESYKQKVETQESDSVQY